MEIDKFRYPERHKIYQKIRDHGPISVKNILGDELNGKSFRQVNCMRSNIVKSISRLRSENGIKIAKISHGGETKYTLGRIVIMTDDGKIKELP